MDLLIKNAIIVDPQSELNGKKRDILIQSGKIQKIGQRISFNAKQIEAKDLCVSPGWFDLKVNFCQPGFEFKEDLNSGIQAAKAGGFTGAAQVPFLIPITHTRSQVDYLINTAKTFNFNLSPIGSLSQNAEGKIISEMFDMYQGGAPAFSDYHLEVNSGLMLKALEYCKAFNGIVMSMPIDHSIAGNAFVHEGKESTALGLKGIPTLSEEIRIQRDIDLLRYTNGRLHFSGVSSSAGIDLIKKAKKEGLNITADVYVHNLVLNEKSILEFDCNKKIFPPARKEKDRKALINGLKNGTIDAICSDHIPVNIENKEVELEYADYGIAGIECVFAILRNLNFDPDLIVDKLSSGPRRVLGLEPKKIEVNQVADLTLFQSDVQFELNANDSKSKSLNNPYLNQELKGKVIAVYCNNTLDLNI